jgi:predicted enzyme related to lactoylglutathione lyase
MSETIHTYITDVRTVSVPVGDQDRALAFYRDVLGLETRLDAHYGDGQRWIELAAPGATTTIALAPPDAGGSTGVDTGIRLLTTDAEADFEALRSRRVEIVGDLMRWPNVPAMFMLRDPDGNLLRVVENKAAADEESAEERGGGEFKRFAVLVKADAATEAGVMPTEQELADMGRFNDELIAAGAMLAGEGLHPTSRGARISFVDGDVQVVRGPFPEAAELVAGFWVIRARSLDEAIDLMRRAPMGDRAEIEIRQVFEAEDFGEAFTPELREQEERQREKVAAGAGPTGS